MAIKEVVNGIKLGTEKTKKKFAFLPKKAWNSSNKEMKIVWFEKYTNIYEYTRDTKESAPKWRLKVRICD